MADTTLAESVVTEAYGRRQRNARRNPLDGAAVAAAGTPAEAPLDADADGFLTAVGRAFTPGVRKIAEALGFKTPAPTDPIAEPAAAARSLQPAPAVDADRPAVAGNGVGAPSDGIGTGKGQGAATGRGNGPADPFGDVADADSEHTAALQDLIDTIDDILNGGTGEDGAAAADGGETDSQPGDDPAGSAGDDQLIGSGGDDTLSGDMGAGTPSGGKGSDVLDGGSGDDQIGGGADDALAGGDWTDWLSGATGSDAADAGFGDGWLGGSADDDALAGGDGTDWLSGGTGSDAAEDGSGDDRLGGSADDDALAGGDGTDWLSGGTGSDALDDRLGGGADDDALTGGGGSDRLSEDGGRDTLDGGGGDDRLAGGAGAETFGFGAGFGNDIVRDLSVADDDRSDLSGAGTSDFRALVRNAESTRRGTVLRIGDGAITLRGVNAGDLTSDHFMLADPTLAGAGQEDDAENGGPSAAGGGTGFTGAPPPEGGIAAAPDPESQTGPVTSQDEDVPSQSPSGTAGGPLPAIAETPAPNTAQTDISLSDSTVGENAVGGTIVGRAAATDADAADTFTYSLTNDAGGRFAIDAATGEITVANGALLDYEGTASHLLTVRVTDSAGDSFEKIMSIGLTNISEAPTDLSLSALEVDEGAAADSMAAAISDPDAGDSHSYDLLDDAGGRFAIDGAAGEITVADATLLDHEGAASHDLTVQVTDAAASGYSEAVTVGVNDRNESTDTFHGEIMANGPVGYWRLGEAGGWNLPAKDETGTATGAWHNTPTSDRDGAFAGIATAATDMHGDDYVTIPDDPAWQLTDGTVQLWIRSDNNRTRQGLISRDAYGDGEAGHFTVLLERNGIDVRVQGPNGGTLSADNVINDNAWHQIAVTFGADGLEIWVDGVMAANDPSITQGIAGNHEDWVIGANNWHSTPGTTDSLTSFFDGGIAEVAIFDSQLGGSAIGELYDAGVNGTDVMTLTGGDDVFGGTAGIDRVEAGAGDDVISGGAGDDFLFGGDGDDTLGGGAGADVLSGGLGPHTLDYADADAGVSIDLGTMTAAGHAAGDTLSGTENVTGSVYDDVLTSDAGANRFAGQGGDHTIFAGDGSDTILFGGGGGHDAASGGRRGGRTDSNLLQNGDGAKVAGGWTITLTNGTVEADDGASLTLSEDAAGVITLADGSEIAFDGMERIDYGS